MGVRPYSNKGRASQILMDLLSAISRRGWFSSGPSRGEEDSLLFASFHVPIEDAERIYLLFTKSAKKYSGKTRWELIKTEENRFFLCPSEVSETARLLGGYNQAVQELSRSAPELATAAAQDLIVLCDHIYTESTKM